MSDNKNSSIMQDILKGAAATLLVTVVSEGVKFYRTLKESVIDVDEYSSAYDKLNEIIFKLDKDKYLKHRKPSVNNNFYELTPDTSYIISLGNRNYIRVMTYLSDNKGYYREKHLKLTFFGKECYYNRFNMLREVLSLSDKDHIYVSQLTDGGMGSDILTRSFDSIVLAPDVKERLVNGLTKWSEDMAWYKNHQLVHKIGVLLYGRPGTGKSSVVRAISNMFDNAPIFTKFRRKAPCFSYGDIRRLFVVPKGHICYNIPADKNKSLKRL